MKVAARASRQDPLKLYKSKRNFTITSEPSSSNRDSSTKVALTFVVQKHWASHLHYDFRLELEGTMKSWAIPKGPSLDNVVKRMAVHVEDHPLSYSNFEGTIPDKQYGAGKVIVWDKGWWQPLSDPNKSYHAGNLKFELHGHKLRGKWVLVRMKSRGEKREAWLLIKEKDQYTRSQSEFSVIDEQPDSVRKLRMPANRTPPLAKGLKRVRLPTELAPQLATLVDARPSDSKDWLYEIKFDGYRLLTRIDKARIGLFTRNGNDWTAKLKPLQQEIATLKLPPGWYDGEIVVLNEKGIPDFGALQQAFDSTSAEDIVLYLFDVPFYDGYDLRTVPLESRRALLNGLMKKKSSQHVRFSDEFDATPESVVTSACKLGLEGVVAKRRDSAYTSGRSPNWIKLKCAQRQEFVVGGYTLPSGERTEFGALLLGVHDATGKLNYAGKVGTGFNQRTLKTIKTQLQAISSKSSPFSASVPGKPHWVKPQLVAEVSFGEWTSSGHIRHSVFHGLRTDKKAKAIVREMPKKVKDISKAEDSTERKSHALSPRLRVTHPDRVIDSRTGITKIELIRYYGLVSELMMEHLKDRPVSLVRAPEGVSSQLFFQRHAATEKLPGLSQLKPGLDPDHPLMLEVTAPLGILSAAQWNVVEFHTRNGVKQSFKRPDRIIFDLDPGAGVSWKHVQEAAELLHAFLEQLGLTAFLKTSGGKGLHVVVPLRRLHDWDAVKDFSKTIVFHLARTIPQRFAAKSGPKNRIGKIFIDYLRNGSSATTVSAWSARARSGLGISIPLDWSEIKSVKSADQWTIRNAHTRLDQGNEPWSGYRNAAQSLTTAIKAMKQARDE